MGRPLAGDSGQRSIKSHDDLIAFATEALHDGRKRECAEVVARFSGNPVKAALTPSQIEQLNFSLLQWTLDNDRYFDAAALLWPVALFTPKPESTRQVWKLWEESSQFLLQGAASMSKSFSIGVRLLLEWVRDPAHTTVKVLGPSEDHLQNNLFSHIVELHQGSAIKLPGVIQSLYIGLEPRSRRGSLAGVVVPLGKKSAAKLQGTKRFPRPKKHPKFGSLSRLFIFMDEVNKIPPGIWSDVDNVLSAARADDIGGFKVGGAFNPQEEGDAVGIRAEPEWGWAQFDGDQHFRWKSKRGWDVLRLDARKSENVLEGKEIFPGLQTKEGMEAIIRNSGGYNTPGYYSMVCAMFPPAAKSFAIIAQGLIHTVKGEVLWASAPVPCGGLDVALEGGDKAVFAHGEWGLARGIKFPPTFENPKGKELLFQRGNAPALKKMLSLQQLYAIPSSATVDLAILVKDLCVKLGVRPEWLCVDRTGNGAGVHDHLKKYWSERTKGVNFYESASSRKIFEEDEKTAVELYMRAVSEMWFAMSKWIEFEYFKVDPRVDTEKLNPQLTGRLFVPGEKTKVESKKEYESRGNTSPDEADAVALLIHAVRMEDLAVLTMNPTPGEVGTTEDDDGPFFWIDSTNLYDHTL